MSKPSLTNCPKLMAVPAVWGVPAESSCYRKKNNCEERLLKVKHYEVVFNMSRYSGGYSTGVPPLPIPNREVKPGHADGTAQAGE